MLPISPPIPPPPIPPPSFIPCPIYFCVQFTLVYHLHLCITGRQRINVKDLTMKLSRQHTVVDDHNKRTFVELTHKIMLMPITSSSSSHSHQEGISSDRNGPDGPDSDISILGDLTMLTILLRNILYFGLVMLDDKQVRRGEERRREQNGTEQDKTGGYPYS